MAETIGKRIYPNEDGRLNFSEPGAYGKDKDGKWFAALPIPGDENFPCIVGNLSHHDVTEHEDGTITVSPSILIDHWDGKSWHGFLERGIWRQV